MSKVVPLKIDIGLGKIKPKEKGLDMVEFANTNELRRNQLEKLVAGFRLFSYFGYDEGVAGHITFRDPEFHDHFWVNPLGVHFSQIKVSDLLLVNHDGEVVQGDRPVNVAAFAIHSRLHKARPDVNAAAHSHSLYGRTFSSLGKMLDQSLKILVHSMRDKQFTTASQELLRKQMREIELLTPLEISRQLFCKTMDCLLLALQWILHFGISSQWKNVVNLN